LATREPAEIILSCFDWHRRTDRLRLLAFCIMPDHYHVLFYLMERGSLSDVMKSIGKFTARQINEHLGKKGQFWQEGYYDHRCRDEDDIDDRLLYIEHNPVREDLVQRAEQWPYSSAFAGNASRSDRDWYADVR
jgi:REP element-mobilizing transposase RayT